MRNDILQWDERHTRLWGHQPIKLTHTLDTSPLFTDDALAELIESYPRHAYSIVHVGERDGERIWREGDLGGLSGKQVIEAIARGRMWLNLRTVHTVDSRYGDLLEEMLETYRTISGMPPILDRNAGILISSPNAQVYYHADLPGQSLLQIRGRKRVYVYPPHAPFITPEQIERILLTGLEVSIDYEPWFDDYAFVTDLEPGDMVHWPLHSPHRVDNHDCLNISMTTEYWTEPIRRTVIANRANALLRSKLGINLDSVKQTGAGFWAKAAFQAGVRRLQSMKEEENDGRPITFRLNPTQLGELIDIDHGSS